MKYLLILCIMALSIVTCFAHDSAQYRACYQKAITQAEMDVCASDTAKEADVQLNDVYSKLLSRAKGDSQALAKIKDAEHAWVIYRDAYIQAMFPAKDKQAQYGSMFPMKADLLKAKLTRQQIASLRVLLKRYSK